jgi:monosaccharide-transporting ATPase
VSTDPLLSARAVSKRYPGVAALEDVGFELQTGEVHALMGQNGAGKSTLLKVLTGAEAPDSGEMTLAGAAYRPRSPAEAQKRGVVAVYQELQLVPTLSVAENICLGRQPRRWWGVDWRAIRSRAAEALRPLGVPIDLDRPVGSLPAALQQLVAIARAIAMDARVLILDEPTSSLDAGEVASLFRVMQMVKERGLGVVFVTHFLEQVYRVSDRITVLRNGRHVRTATAAEMRRSELVSLMLGHEAETAANASRSGPARGVPVLEARELGAPPALQPVTLTVAPGEVLGLAGLLGSGRTEAAELVFGARRATTGEVRIARRRIRPSPRRSIAAGLALSPEERKRDGLFGGMSIRDNIAIVSQRRMSRFGLLSRRRHVRVAARLAEQVGISADLRRPARTLSGGNQQKALLARWLATSPRVLILDEPTRGVDIGGKAQIEELVQRLAAGAGAEPGLGVIFISAELEEVVRRCSRVLVLRDRAPVRELADDEVSLDRILALISE